MKARGSTRGLSPVIADNDERIRKLERHRHTPVPEQEITDQFVVRVKSEVAFPIPVATWTAIPFEAQDVYDPSDMHNETENNERIWFPEPGTYSGGACIEFDANFLTDVNVRGLTIRKTGDGVVFLSKIYIDINAYTDPTEHTHAIAITDPEHAHVVSVDISDAGDLNHKHDIVAPTIEDAGEHAHAIEDDGEHTHEGAVPSDGDHDHDGETFSTGQHDHGGDTEISDAQHGHSVGGDDGFSEQAITGVTAAINPDPGGEHFHEAYAWPAQLAWTINFEDHFELGDYIEVMVYTELPGDSVIVGDDYSPRAWAHKVVTGMTPRPVEDDDGGASGGAPCGDSGGGVFGEIAIQDEIVPLGDVTTINFEGAGVTATVLAGTATVTIPGGGGGGGHVIEDEGTPLTQRADMNFVGAGVTATDAGGKTVITIPAATISFVTLAKWN